ncbi:ATP-binding protein [Streptomyces sp. NBC_01465]|uniref:ATP-binding protein n=1 Tax=Streptomyces sp. NBC_01465 TaxID=2903878 RepID=UPI002E32542C|nr:ATP-binding protein [Streptomyces sp. NBC_01465]
MSTPHEPQLPASRLAFVQRFSATRRGARLARLLAAKQLRTWDVPYDTAWRTEQIVAELAANAALHGQLRGRGFKTALALDVEAGTVRVEVADARGERLPEAGEVPESDGESGRGLLLVTALADKWGTELHRSGGKTVWALIAVR